MNKFCDTLCIFNPYIIIPWLMTPQLRRKSPYEMTCFIQLNPCRRRGDLDSAGTTNHNLPLVLRHNSQESKDEIHLRFEESQGLLRIILPSHATNQGLLDCFHQRKLEEVEIIVGGANSP